MRLGDYISCKSGDGSCRQEARTLHFLHVTLDGSQHTKKELQGQAGGECFQYTQVQRLQELSLGACAVAQRLKPPSAGPASHMLHFRVVFPG